MSPILALSVAHKIEQYGSYAGFASVLGLAVLSLLYFAQAREVKRLREWAGRAPERDAELQQRIQADAARRVVAQPQPPAAQPQPQPAQASAAKPAAGPATAAGQAAAPAAAPAAAAAAATAAGAAAKAAPGPGGSAGPAAPPAPGQPTTVQPAAGSAPPTPNGAPAAPPAKPGQPLRVPSTPAGARASTATPPPPAEPPRRRRSALAIAAPIAAVLIVLVVGAILIFGGGGGDKAAKKPSTTPASATTPAAGGGTSTTGAASNAPLKPANIRTAVLNGTTTPGLARGVANRLGTAGFRIGTVTNAADQSRSQTLVEYAPGRKQAGLLVAKAIDVSSDAVQPMSAGSRTIAGEAAMVVVTVGSDQNQPPQQ